MIILELIKFIPKKNSLKKSFLSKEIPLTISESKYKLANIANTTNANIEIAFFFIHKQTLNYLNTFPH